MAELAGQVFRLLASEGDAVQEGDVLAKLDATRYQQALDVLLRRFSETRRPHPLPGASSVEDGITREREALHLLRECSDRIIDTSRFNVHELKAYLYDHFSDEDREASLLISVLSFGYKHGLPQDADLVFDVRFLPNPYFVHGLREKTGRDREVAEYLGKIEEYRQFCSKLEDLFNFLLPQYVREGKTYLTVAFGCTGGRHRSVALSEQVGTTLQSQGLNVRIAHRDVTKDL